MRVALGTIALCALAVAGIWLVTRGTAEPRTHRIVLTRPPPTTLATTPVVTRELLTVPNVIGKRYDDAADVLAAAGLRHRAVPYPAKAHVKSGTIVQQAPQPGRKAVPRARVLLFVASR